MLAIARAVPNESTITTNAQHDTRQGTQDNRMHAQQLCTTSWGSHHTLSLAAAQELARSTTLG
eukprot:2090783-Rhodomonas_salina.3